MATRRSDFTWAGVGPSAGARTSPAIAGDESGSARPTYVLVHGAWHGGWCWRRVSDRLVAAGHSVFTPSLTGLGDRCHLLNRETTLDTHIRDIIGLIETEELCEVILVGHSYGGIVITGVAAQIPQHLKQLIYLDAVLVEDGDSWSTAHPPDIVAARRKSVQESSGGPIWPVPKSTSFGVIDADDQAWVDRRMTPHPFCTYDQQMHWGGPIGNHLPKVYVDCTDPAMPALAAMKDSYRGKAEWPFIEIQTGHDAMVTAPKELTEILLRFA
jgi:pimeloyl-ACP methyl ester carboxylesterase